MRATDIIAKKRDGQTLQALEIDWFIQEFTQGNIPDYQASAWLMAVFSQGMRREEIVNLTLAMARSGEQIDLPALVGGYAVDKHSSGGVGDKTSLVVVPLVAACGVPVAKMSGRGLGHTGGTLDKLESIRGFRVELSFDEFARLAREAGIVLAGQSANLAPADKALYALRDVTATVNSVPLIASSIMSKKLAAGANGILLDVKVGHGAFMPNLEQARELAQMMVNIGVDAGRDMAALITDMNQPLGAAAGLALEVQEAIATLNGRGPADFTEHCLLCAAHMLRLAGRSSLEAARQQAAEALRTGAGLAKFRQMVELQGGDVAQVDDPDRLPRASLVQTLVAKQTAYIAQVNALSVGYAVLDLGGGRLTKSDPVDHAVGVITHVKVGDRIAPDQPLFTLHANDPARLKSALDTLADAIRYSAEPVAALPAVYDTLIGSPA
ncbi:MAG: thymidine phosphorylase [Anaerolineae bacterium]|nr:thymidine phosphorylase [Anaerolineae bacterium]